MQSCVVCKVCSMMEVRGTHRDSMVGMLMCYCFSANTAGCVRSDWQLKLYLSLVCEIARTTGKLPYHVGRVMTCQRTKKIATCCAMCAISKWIMTQPGDIRNFHDCIKAFGHGRACYSGQVSCCDVRKKRARMREHDPFRKCATGRCRTQT